MDTHKPWAPICTGLSLCIFVLGIFTLMQMSWADDVNKRLDKLESHTALTKRGVTSPPEKTPPVDVLQSVRHEHWFLGASEKDVLTLQGPPQRMTTDPSGGSTLATWLYYDQKTLHKPGFFKGSYDENPEIDFVLFTDGKVTDYGNRTGRLKVGQ